MFDSTKYVGIPYDSGRNDCYGLVRRYYRDVWGLELPNLARPEAFWEDPNLDLLRNFRARGFQVVIDEDPQLGDGLIMPLYASMNTHTAVVCGDNQVLHHLPGRLSSIDRLRPTWMARTTIVVRHPTVSAAREKLRVVKHFHEVSCAPLLRDAKLQSVIDHQMGAKH